LEKYLALSWWNFRALETRLRLVTAVNGGSMTKIFLGRGGFRPGFPL
jgi:hypothetical protein